MSPEEKRPIPEKVVERLSIYRRILHQLKHEGKETVHSPQLAQRAQCTAVQVRRDLMAINYYGNPARGYSSTGLLTALDRFLDTPGGVNIVIVGLGHLGRAVLDYFGSSRPALNIVAGFDKLNPGVSVEYHGVPGYPIEKLEEIVARHGAEVGIICVPATEAPAVADLMIEAGIRGILNFAPVRLEVPPHVFLEEVDLAVSLEKVAFFSRLSPVADDDRSDKEHP